MKIKHLSAYLLLCVGGILVVEPLFPQYTFSLFWFSLGIFCSGVALYDLLRGRKQWKQST